VNVNFLGDRRLTVQRLHGPDHGQSRDAQEGDPPRLVDPRRRPVQALPAGAHAGRHLPARFLEDVQLDFVPADSTDVDITLRVKEEAGGHGLGGRSRYTAQGGFTGFIELGHNNVLGNGQSP
jgi:hypothetical protein